MKTLRHIRTYLKYQFKIFLRSSLPEGIEPSPQYITPNMNKQGQQHYKIESTTFEY